VVVSGHGDYNGRTSAFEWKAALSYVHQKPQQGHWGDDAGQQRWICPVLGGLFVGIRLDYLQEDY